MISEVVLWGQADHEAMLRGTVRRLWRACGPAAQERIARRIALGVPMIWGRCVTPTPAPARPEHTFCFCLTGLVVPDELVPTQVDTAGFSRYQWRQWCDAPGELRLQEQCDYSRPWDEAVAHLGIERAAAILRDELAHGAIGRAVAAAEGAP